MNNPPDIFDSKGNKIRQWDIVRVDHFQTKRGRGYQMHYMYKIACIEDYPNPSIGKQWFFYHTPERVKGDGYYPSPAKSQKFEEYLVIDSSELLKEMYP